MNLPWKRLVAAVALAVAATAVPAGGAAASETSAPSSGWNDYTCRPSAAHPRPVVLVPGTGGNSVDNFLVLAPYLVQRGYCVFSLDYGQLPGETLFDGLGPIADSAQQLSDFTDHVLAVTGAAKTDMIGHSQGGMMPRYYLKFLGGASKVNTLVGIAPSSHGTTLSGLTNLLPYIPGLKQYLEDNAPGLTDQALGSAFLAKLNADGDTVPGVHYTVIYTKFDEVVTPYTTQPLSGSDVHNVLLQNLCAIDVSEHLAIGLTDKIAFHEAANALDPAHATSTNCLSALG